MVSDAKKCLCAVLSLVLLFSSISVAVAADGQGSEAVVSCADSVDEALEVVAEGKASCSGNCGTSPVIIVPGIMQSQVYVQDENGNDLMTSDGFPIVEGMDIQFMFDTVKLKGELPGLIMPFVLSIITGNKDIFLDKLVEIADHSTNSHYFNPDGTRVYNVEVDEYWYSLEECKKHPDKSYNYAKGYHEDENGNALPTVKYPTEYDFIMRQVDLSNYCDKVGYDHAYYYAYSSFGDTFAIAERLNDYVQMVKEQTGHDKVSIVFVSLGGTIGNVYLSEYCNPDDIDKMVFAAAAADGSSLLGDLMALDFTLDDNKVLYTDLIPNLIGFASDEYTWAGYLANIIIRILPQKVFSDWLNSACERIVGEVAFKIISNCPSMWALVPSERYVELSNKLISDEAHTLLKEKTDAYYEIQKKSAETLRKKTDEGMMIFVVCGYNLDLPSILGSFGKSSDNIIEATSTSFGATVAPVGETLPEDYVPAIDESYISPYNEIDAGTAALPDRTWFIRNQSHLRLQTSTNDIINMCVQIAVNDNIKDARVNNGGYKQFNNYRDLRGSENLMWQYYDLSKNGKLEAANPTEGQRAELIAAHTRVIELRNSLDWDNDVARNAEKRLYIIMYDLKILNDMSKTPYEKYDASKEKELKFKNLSEMVLEYYGARDFYS